MDPGLHADIKRLVKLKDKVLQAVRVRSGIIKRKIDLFKEIKNKGLSRKRLGRFEALHKREVRLVKIFDKGIHNAQVLLHFLEEEAKKEHVPLDIRETIDYFSGLMVDFSKQVQNYGTRLKAEGKFLGGRLWLWKKLHFPKILQSFKEEVSADIKLLGGIHQFKKEVGKLTQKIERKIEAQRDKKVVSGEVGLTVAALFQVRSGHDQVNSLLESALGGPVDPNVEVLVALCVGFSVLAVLISGIAQSYGKVVREEREDFLNMVVDKKVFADVEKIVHLKK